MHWPGLSRLVLFINRSYRMKKNCCCRAIYCWFILQQRESNNGLSYSILNFSWKVVFFFMIVRKYVSIVQTIAIKSINYKENSSDVTSPPKKICAKPPFLICFNSLLRRFHPRSHVQRGIRISGLTRDAEGNPSEGIKVIIFHVKNSLLLHINNF